MDLPIDSWRFIIAQLRRWDEVDSTTRSRSEGEPESRFLERARMLENLVG